MNKTFASWIFGVEIFATKKRRGGENKLHVFHPGIPSTHYGLNNFCLNLHFFRLFLEIHHFGFGLNLVNLDFQVVNDENLSFRRVFTHVVR